jgi:(p)ppGpp synthase/HD superfamily hydrolase
MGLARQPESAYALDMFSPTRYVETMRYAATKHNAQKEPGHDLPYLVHVVSVAAEVIAALPVAGLADNDLAVTCALLHDTVEDTGTPLDEIRARFGDAVAAGVSALTKNEALPKPEQMPDSLRRIREQPPEIAAVKLADRITNLSAPPHYWSKEKCAAYRVEAMKIADALGDACPALEARLRARIEEYAAYC